MTTAERARLRAALREKIEVRISVPKKCLPDCMLIWSDDECDDILDAVCKVLFEIAKERKFVS